MTLRSTQFIFVIPYFFCPNSTKIIINTKRRYKLKNKRIKSQNHTPCNRVKEGIVNTFSMLNYE